jgi:hypothetical protein
MMRWLVAASAFVLGLACFIQGHDSGMCREIEEVESEMPFCGSVVRYTACVPKEFAWFPNHTLAKKDMWAKEMYTQIVERRIRIERGDFPDNAQPWEAADGNAITRFRNNDDCLNAYKNFLCWLNFPRCDAQGESMVLCRSVCQNFFQACNYPSVMERCYAPEYYGGEEAEADTLVDDQGLPIYLRAFFPGTPFRENQFFEDDSPQLICTPSIKDGAGTVGVDAVVVAASMVVFAALAVAAAVP